MEDTHAKPSTLSRLELEVLGGPRVLSLPELAERLGVSEERLAQVWQPFGLPDDRDEKIFTERDAQVVGHLLAVSEQSRLDQATISSLVRSAAHLADRLAVWQLEALVDHLADRYGFDDAAARTALLARLPAVVPLLEEQLVATWRRQLVRHAEILESQVAKDGATAHATRLPLGRAVGFADIVSFTARTAGLGAEGLAEFVQEFEAQARDVVSRAGGRTVKTIGDAVFFVADDLAHGAAVALDLAAAFPVAGPTPVRVGMVWGHVLARFGDLYGTPVNVAARLTTEAAPGEVLVDAATAELLSGDPQLRLTPLPVRELAGVGPVAPSRLERALRSKAVS